jgi:hypothetical protein
MSSCHPARHEAEHINSIQTANIADSNGLGVAIFAILSKKKGSGQRLRLLRFRSAQFLLQVTDESFAPWQQPENVRNFFLNFETISPKDSSRFLWAQ